MALSAIYWYKKCFYFIITMKENYAAVIEMCKGFKMLTPFLIYQGDTRIGENKTES
jgi:hypothetical protein